MDVLQDAYKASNGSAKPDNDLLLSTQQKSFESIVKAPYHSFNAYENGARSVESPYTSLGSGRSSYVSIKPVSYNSLRAKSLRANEQHESKSKAVMKALQNLQSKINVLEVDRAKAESNLKTLASETTEYKEILKQKHDHSSSFHSPHSTKRDSYSEELENQLENAQGRCEVLEKQLEYMRKVMLSNDPPPQPTALRSPTTPKKQTQFSWSTNSTLNDIQQLRRDSPQHNTLKKQQQQQTTTTPSARLLKPVQESPALEKLNGLEREHVKLSTSQSRAENKIRELEERIREESHCRKLLEDKAYELEQAVAKSHSNGVNKKVTVEPKVQRTKKKRVKKKIVSQHKPPITSSSSSKHTTPRSPRHHQPPTPTSPNHYLLDLANIPFVVGQSTTRSHSVGANVQNVLSIMKSHSKLCSGADIHTTESSPRSPSKCRSPKSRNELQLLLQGLTEEFEQLGDEHRLITHRLDHESSEIMQKNYENELGKTIKKMETKGKQITTIRHFLKSGTNSLHHHKQPNSTSRMTLGSQEIQVVTTIRAPKASKPSSATVDTRTNKNLELLKKVQKLQHQLQKDDLKWE